MNSKEITVYFADISTSDAEKLLETYGTNMEPRRRASIEKCTNTKVKKLMVGAGSLVSRVLSEYGYKGSDIAYKEHGKPYLRDEKLFFNLSHSGNRLMLAVSAFEIGADIQKKVPYRENLVKRITKESERIGRTEEYEKHLNRVWAIKESYTKLTGEGLGLDFSLIDYSYNGDAISITCEGRSDAVCRMIFINEDYEACVSAYNDFSVTVVSMEL